MAEQIKFTEDVENAIQDHSLHQIEAQLVNKLEHYTDIDTSSEDPGNTGMGKCSIFCLLFSYLNIFCYSILIYCFWLSNLEVTLEVTIYIYILNF